MLYACELSQLLPHSLVKRYFPVPQFLSHPLDHLLALLLLVEGRFRLFYTLTHPLLDLLQAEQPFPAFRLPPIH